MSTQLYFDHQRKVTNLHTVISVLVVIVGALFFSLHLTNQNFDDKIAEQRKIDAETIDNMAAEIGHLSNRLYEQQSEVQAIERAKDEAFRKTEAKRKKAQFIEAEVSCLADNIYHESVYEPENGQLAVATVTMNRVADPIYPKSVCGVVYERHIKKTSGKIVCMFSWTCKPMYAMHPSLYHKILSMAKAVYFKHLRNDDVQDAVLYHASYVSPDWANPDNMVAQIGQHLFYRQ